MAQKRWVAAALYGLGFLAAFSSVLLFSGRILFAYYSFGLSMDLKAEPPRLKQDIVGIAVSMGIAVILYLAGLIDAWQAYRKSVSGWADARREEAFVRITGTSSGGSSQAG